MQTLNSVVGIIQLHKLYTCSNLYAIKKWCNNRRICLQALKCTSITWFHVSHFQDLKLWNTHTYTLCMCVCLRQREREIDQEREAIPPSVIGVERRLLGAQKARVKSRLTHPPPHSTPSPHPPLHLPTPSIALRWGTKGRLRSGVCVCVGVKG